MKQLDQKLAADQFWAWFTQHSTLLAQLPHKDNNTFAYWMGELHTRLRAYSQRYLYADIDWCAELETGRCQLIISAGGHLRHFPTVEALVERAPRLHHWNVQAFYPPQEDPCIMQYWYKEAGIDPDDLWFSPIELKHTRISGKPFLTVYARVQTPVNAKFTKGIKSTLIHLLGERAFLDLAGVRVKGYKGLKPRPGKQLFNLQALPAILPCLDQVSLVVNAQGELEQGINLE